MIKTMKALIQREYWEHRGAFIKTPIIVGIVLLVLSIIAYITGLVMANKTGSGEMVAQGMLHLASLEPEKLIMFWEIQMIQISSLYLTVLFFVMFFFLLGSLYDDRKDGSILFWKSIPISDTTTVMSKLLTALFFVPLTYLGVFLVVTLLTMVLFTVILSIHGLNPIHLIWQPASVIGAAKLMLFGIIIQMLWALPVYGWLMFCSAWKKTRPFLFAIFVPVIIAFSWYWINVLSFKFTDFSMLKQPLNHLGHAILPYASGSFNGHSFNMSNFNDSSTSVELIDRMITSITKTEILYGAIFAAVFIAISIWVRRYRNTT